MKPMPAARQTASVAPTVVAPRSFATAQAARSRGPTLRGAGEGAKGAGWPGPGRAAPGPPGLRGGCGGGRSLREGPHGRHTARRGVEAELRPAEQEAGREGGTGARRVGDLGWTRPRLLLVPHRPRL